MKPLSQMLEEQVCAVNLSEPTDSDLARLKREYDKVRLVAIELAKWIEQETSCNRLSFRHVRPCSRCDALARAKDIIGGDK